MHKRYFPFPLIAVALIAMALTTLASGTYAGRLGVQDSPLEPTATDTLGIDAPTAFPDPDRPLPVETPPFLEPTKSVPLPAPVEPVATVSSFLPAPTITNPDEVKSLPLARPAVSGGGGGAETAPAATSQGPANAALLASVAILNGLWLICGSVLLIGGIVFIILLARRRSDT